MNGKTGTIRKKVFVDTNILVYAHRADSIHHTPAQELVRFSGTQFDPDVVDAFAIAVVRHKDQWPLSRQQEKS